MKGDCGMFTKTLKLQIIPDKNDITAFTTLINNYKDACNLVSSFVFNNEFNLSQSLLNRCLYSDIRQQFHLMSQSTQSTFKTVIAKYKTVQTQLSQKPYRYQDGNGAWISAPKDLSWLQKPIQFSMPQADLVYNRDYRFKDNFRVLRVTTGDGLVDVKTVGLTQFNHYFDGSWKFGTAKLVVIKHKWYLHIPVSKELSSVFDIESVKHVIGIDRGLRQIMTCYDEKGITSFSSGKQVIRKRRKYNELRRRLQSKNTKGSKRRLRLLEHKENRWMTDVNHQLSKALIAHYGANSLFVLEDLTGVRFTTENVSRTLRYELVSWSFYQLESFLRYKAHEIGSEILLVDAHYTSQRCPKCGTIDKTNRDHYTHLYTCKNCDYSSNDDRIGAMNIQLLGTRYISGETNPRYKR